ncbi:hypothetical protein [Pseudophaeobacter sp.]|uniref:hypothetical protein n=1 Tax=Pseudophaeobacter sp. TaxID=1971739 RepID=UPI003299945F
MIAEQTLELRLLKKACSGMFLQLFDKAFGIVRRHVPKNGFLLNKITSLPSITQGHIVTDPGGSGKSKHAAHPFHGLVQ